jgi:DNA helicase IV
VVAVHRERGLLVLDPVSEASAGAQTIALNRKVSALRDAVPSMSRTRIHRFVVDPRSDDADPKVLTGNADVRARIERLPCFPVDDEIIGDLASALELVLTIDVPIRRPMKDADASERRKLRVTLDEHQAEVARRQTGDIVALTGPPGSGKTLVLVARAKWLAEQHPDWRIQVLCFNRVLVPYLELLVDGHPNVAVQTFGKFAHALGFRVSLDDEERSRRDVDRQLTTARSLWVLDALLIDEWQDFHPAWTELCAELVKPGRGGITLAGDPQQALYRDAQPLTLRGHAVDLVTLDRPYRSTRQVLEVTSALSDTLAVPGRELAPEGQPVDLVWAHNTDEQAAAVARDVLLLVETGERLPAEIGILATRKFLMGRIARHLQTNGIPCRAVYANQASELDLGEPTVKILTVHSAKGLEFDVVFLVGLEHLPDPDGTDEVARQGRTGYVGATRARDQLVMSYSKDNVYLERIRQMPDDVLQRWVWPDDYPEA